MSDHHHHYNNGGSGFLNGFLLGLVAGAGIVFLLGTKRGKELVDEFSEKGLSALDDIEETFAEIEEDTGQTPSLPPSPSSPHPTPDAASSPSPSSTPSETRNPQLANATSSTNGNGGVASQSGLHHIETLQAQGRRLFHGIPKRR